TELLRDAIAELLPQQLQHRLRERLDGSRPPLDADPEPVEAGAVRNIELLEVAAALPVGHGAVHLSDLVQRGGEVAELLGAELRLLQREIAHDEIPFLVEAEEEVAPLTGAALEAEDVLDRRRADLGLLRNPAAPVGHRLRDPGLRPGETRGALLRRLPG